jgi:hypothetical protein
VAVMPKIDALVDVPLWLFHGSEDRWCRSIFPAIFTMRPGGWRADDSLYRVSGRRTCRLGTGRKRTDPRCLVTGPTQRCHTWHTRSVSNVLAVKINDHRLQLTWDLPSNKTHSDNQIWYCQVYRNGQVIAMVDNIAMSYTDTTVSAGATYQYSISAVNYFFKESAKSTPLQITITLN